MNGRIFVTGMLRSGTTLLQTLLTNHPRLLVAYQPFHQLYVNVKRTFLKEHATDRMLPLDDGSVECVAEREAFTKWLATRQFNPCEAQSLADDATTGKGGGLSELTGTFKLGPGTFPQLVDALHDSMASALGREDAARIGSKEILCEEYIPSSLDAGMRCLLIVRDPRAVVASANHGRYQALVGDRYPLLMLVRMWRKSADYWLRYQHDPRVCTIRYEDLLESAQAQLNRITTWLGVGEYPPTVLQAPLRDHAGRPWRGNSSFGDKAHIDISGRDAWQDHLNDAEIDFIEACTRMQMAALGYRNQGNAGRAAIEGFIEDPSGVRAAYLDRHGLGTANRELELRTWAAASGSGHMRRTGSHE